MNKSGIIYKWIFYLGWAMPWYAAAQVGINITGNDPHPSAMMDIDVTEGGLLIPRLTQAQRDAVVDPAVSLVIYQTDNEEGFYYYNGTQWVRLLPESAATPGAQEINDMIDGRSDRDGSDEYASVFIGWEAGMRDDQSFNQNTATGYQALKNVVGAPDVAGVQDEGIGYQALTTLGTHSDDGEIIGGGHWVTGIGYQAGMHADVLENAVLAGYQAGYSINSVDVDESNMVTVAGRSALYSATIVLGAFAMGAGAFYMPDTVKFSAAFGYQAGRGAEIFAGYGAQYLSLLGAKTGYNLSRHTPEGAVLFGTCDDDFDGANKVVALGYKKRNLNFIGSEGNVTYIGYDMAAGMGDENLMRVGNTYITSIGGYADWTTFSDGRFKRNIREDVPGLELVMALRPVTYRLDVQKLQKFLGLGIPQDKRLLEGIRRKEGERQIGFIAQEVEEAARRIRFSFHAVDRPADTTGGTYGLRYGEFVPVLVKAIQQQQSRLHAIDRELDRVENDLRRFEQQWKTKKNNVK